MPHRFCDLSVRLITPIRLDAAQHAAKRHAEREVWLKVSNTLLNTLLNTLRRHSLQASPLLRLSSLEKVKTCRYCSHRFSSLPD